MGGKDMGRIRFIVFSLALLLFTAYSIRPIKAENLMFICANMQYVSLLEYSPETYVENDFNNHEDTHNTKIKTENLILKWSLGGILILLIISIIYLFILSRKYLSLKSHRECYKETIIDIGTTDDQHNEIDTEDIQNEALNLFQSIDKVMREKKLYTNVDFNRDTMVRMFNTNKNKLNEALMAGCGMNYSKYICELRLQESIRIIEEDNNISLNDLAMHCGFNTYSSFYRSFCKRFGIGPAEYKLGYKKKNKTLK